MKAEIHVMIDESGRVLCNTTSKNIVTTLGMLETAKLLFMKDKFQNESDIKIPSIIPVN